MSKKSKKTSSDRDSVITPGGPRAKEKVHTVRPGEAVRFDSEKSAGSGAQTRYSPHEMVVTPGGPRHRSQVHEIQPGHALLHADDGRVQKLNLTTKKLSDFPDAQIPAGSPPALGSGWITYAYWNNGSGRSISSFRTTWKVPPVPSSQNNQLIYLFNGIQNYGTNFGILQPVLQWGNSGGGLGGGPYWSVSSWYVTSGGNAYHTPQVKVNAGDTLVGVMTLTGSSGGKFSYTSEFQGIAGTNLPVQNIAELLWCNETLEAYRVNDCSEYPATSHTAMRAIEIHTGNTQPAITWTPVDKVTDCGQHTEVVDDSASNGEVDLYFRKKKSRFAGFDFINYIDPLLLWLFKHGWEDPGWGRNQEGQLAIASAIRTLAGQLTDEKLQKEIQTAAEKAVAKASRKSGPER